MGAIRVQELLLEESNESKQCVKDFNRPPSTPARVPRAIGVDQLVYNRFVAPRAITFESHSGLQRMQSPPRSCRPISLRRRTEDSPTFLLACPRGRTPLLRKRPRPSAPSTSATGLPLPRRLHSKRKRVRGDVFAQSMRMSSRLSPPPSPPLPPPFRFIHRRVIMDREELHPAHGWPDRAPRRWLRPAIR